MHSLLFIPIQVLKSSYVLEPFQKLHSKIYILNEVMRESTKTFVRRIVYALLFFILFSTPLM